MFPACINRFCIFWNQGNNAHFYPFYKKRFVDFAKNSALVELFAYSIVAKWDFAFNKDKQRFASLFFLCCGFIWLDKIVPAGK